MPKMLLVDDDEDILLLLGEYLNSRDQEFDKATCVSHAKRLLKKFRYDMIVSDFNMPLESGLDLLRHVSNDYPEIPFVLMTGCEDDRVKREAMRMGAAAFITKPFNLNELMETIVGLVQFARLSPDQVVKNFIRKYGNTPILEHQA
jgi:two-component system response regulator PilR (NtrC family)